MPRSKSRGRGRRGNQGEKRKSRNSPSRSIPNVVLVLSDSDEYVPESLITSEPQQQRRKRTRKRSQRNQSAQSQEVHVDLTHEANKELSVDSSVSNRRRPQRRGRGTQRATVISLDVTYSSDELNEALSSPERTPERFTGFVLSPSPKKVAASASEDSESDIGKEEAISPVREEQETCKYENFSESDEEDLFFVDYNAETQKALKSAVKEYKAYEKEEAKQKETLNANTDEDVIGLRKEGASSLQNNSLDLDISFDLSDVKLPANKKKKKCKKLREVQKQIKKFEKELYKTHVDDVFSKEIIIESDEEEDVNPSITLLIKWDSTLLRWPVRQYQKFSTVYKEVAERFSLDVDQVLLCFNDKVISPDVCPKDLKLSVGDILEGGVQSQPTVVEKGPSLAQKGNCPDSIPLKIQNANKKGLVTIYIKRTDKMIKLMHMYAEEKNVKLETLIFKFDGETLDPSDTPKSLDLEGDECIDVYSR